jgi:ParB/RepB/Spo0J family partition protein
MTRHALIPLGELRPGAAVNPRRHGRKLGLAELVASITANGLLQPLIVREPERSLTAGGYERRVYEVIDGNRRLEALRKIHGREPVDIPCMIVDGDGGEERLREISLAANVVRAAGKAKASGWLPPELRTCAYAGPPRPAQQAAPA